MSDTLVLIVVMLAGGYLSARRGWLPAHSAEVLDAFVINVCLPALVLSIVPNLRIEPDLLWAGLVPWLLLGIGAALVVAVSRVLEFERPVRAALLLCVPLGNTSFLGFPMLEALLGLPAVRVGVLYDQLGSFLIVATYGLLVVARYQAALRPTFGTIVRRVVRFPPFLALCTAMVIAAVPGGWPPVFAAIVERVGACLVPIAMFAVGLKVKLRPPRPWSAFLVGLSIKMLVLPACALLIVRAAGVAAPTARVIVVESAMPSMVTAAALAATAGFAPELAAALVGYGILLSLFTLPLWAAL